jgi:hypothetical protein
MKAKTKPSQGSLVFASHAKTIPVTQSAIDSLFSKKEGNTWPATVLTNSRISKDLEIRKKLLNLCNILLNTNNGDFLEAYASGLVEEQYLIEFYVLLGQELTKPEVQRIILYLPFECLPAKKWKVSSSQLDEAIHCFIENYRAAWYQVVNEWDFRADFIDGDIPEVHEYPVDEAILVCKAAHLIPILVEKGIFSKEEIFSLLENSDDPVLRQSIEETFPTLYEMGLLSEDEVQKLKVDFSQPETFIVQLEQGFTKRKDWLEELTTRVEITQGKVLSELVRQKNTMRPERFVWKKDDSRRKVLEQYGHELAKLLSRESIFPLEEKLLLDINNQDILLVVIFAVRESVETTYHASVKKALELKTLWKQNLLSLYLSGGKEVREVIESTWSRWGFLRLVPLCEKQKLPFMIQIEEQTFEMICKTEHSEEAKAIFEKLELNTELLEFVYPTLLMYGSLVKGYASGIADLDLAVFVRPEVPIEKRGYVQKLLRENISSKSMKSLPLEFWISENGDKLTIRDFETTDASLGDSSLIHVLWKGLWFGDKSTVEMFHGQLLTNYLGLSEKEKLTRELERGLLQYRLMHKGYDRLYPKGRSFQTKFGHDLGIESRFWDSGYRKLATECFVKNVFVPYLDK